MFKLTSGVGIASLMQRNQKDLQNENEDLLDGIKIVAVESLSSPLNKLDEDIKNCSSFNYYNDFTASESEPQVDRLKCQFCGQKMDDLFSLALHVRKSNCTIRSVRRGMQAKRLSSSNVFLLSHQDRKFECENCGKYFRFLNGLRKHFSKLCRRRVADKDKFLCKSEPVLGDERYEKRETILTVSSSQECHQNNNEHIFASSAEIEAFPSSVGLFAVKSELKREYYCSGTDCKVNVSTTASTGLKSRQVFETQGVLSSLECKETMASPSVGIISSTQSVKNLLGVSSGGGYDSESTVEDEKVSCTNSLSTDTLSPSSSVSMHINGYTPPPRGKRRRSFAAGYEDSTGENCKLPRKEATEVNARSADVQGFWTEGVNGVVGDTAGHTRMMKGVGSRRSDFVGKDASLMGLKKPDYSIVKMKDYQCEYCPQKFSREAILKSHVKNRHERCISEASMSSSSLSPRQSPEEEMPTNSPQKSKRRSLQRSDEAYHSTPNRQNIYIPSPSTSARGGNLPAVRVPLKTQTTEAKSVRRTQNPKSFSESRTIRSSEDRGGSNTSPVEALSRSHIRSVSSSGNFTCNECNKSFATKDELVSDLLRHNERKDMAPESPVKVFRGVRKTGTVLSGPQRKAAYKCVICGGGFYERDVMMNHVRSSHDRPGRYGCMKCPVIRPNALELVHHYDMAHKPSIQKPSDALRSDSTNAVSYNETKGASGTQNKMKKALSNIAVPTAISPVVGTKSGSYSCKYLRCGQTFQSHGELKEHWKTAHSATVPMNFLCDFPGCGAPFALEQGLRNHIRREHK